MVEAYFFFVLRRNGDGEYSSLKKIASQSLKGLYSYSMQFTTQSTKSSFFLTFPLGAIFQLESLLLVSGTLPIYPGPLQGKYAAQNKVPTCATELDSTKTTPRPFNFSWPIGFSLTWSLTPVFLLLSPLIQPLC